MIVFDLAYMGMGVCACCICVFRIVALLDDMSRSSKDVLVMVNVSSLSSGINTILRLTLSSVRYDIAISRLGY